MATRAGLNEVTQALDEADLEKQHCEHGAVDSVL
jgi:hypothetical protein